MSRLSCWTRSCENAAAWWVAAMLQRDEFADSTLLAQVANLSFNFLTEISPIMWCKSLIKLVGV
jgi:hypothetical protein